MFDYSKLIGRIIEVCGTQYNFAKAMDMSEETVSKKLNNKVTWRDADILKACKVLSIDIEKIPEYFFKQKVQIFELEHS